MRALSTAASVVRHSVGAVGEALLIAAIIAALLLALAPVYAPANFLSGTGVADAARGGNRGARLAADLQPSCNPCALGTTVHFNGSGFDASQGKAMLNIGGGWTSTRVAADGSVSFDWPYFQVAADYDVSAYQTQGNRMVVVAAVTVAVR
jgi:hypothetical protein